MLNILKNTYPVTFFWNMNVEDRNSLERTHNALFYIY